MQYKFKNPVKPCLPNQGKFFFFLLYSSSSGFSLFYFHQIFSDLDTLSCPGKFILSVPQIFATQAVLLLLNFLLLFRTEFEGDWEGGLFISSLEFCCKYGVTLGGRKSITQKMKTVFDIPRGKVGLNLGTTKQTLLPWILIFITQQVSKKFSQLITKQKP